MPRPTMFDEYGRCIHCGFWHEDLDGPAAQHCGEHEARFNGHCGCHFKKLPKPDKGKDGKWYAPGWLAPDQIAPSEPDPARLHPANVVLFAQARQDYEQHVADVLNKAFAASDGVALISAAHPLPPWYRRPWHWLRRLFGYPRLNPASVETVEIEIKERK